ncbi:MAG: (Fe-S)-binding protein [Cohaesibacteraceae bacterium]|nr:(Fe-S)-binding protein [Cohaesibacteraceae bacterium]MBL4874984.1 (Fe-S)-binding protein [Cohaesibacteraceae bacterium]
MTISTQTLDLFDSNPKIQPNVGLFVTCLVDLFRPSVGFSAVKLLEDAGCRVDVPVSQTCCGQPAYNSGDKADTRDIAKNTIKAFERFDYVVAPSGSCAGMLKKHYPELFKDDADWLKRANALAEKTHELISFLTDHLGIEKVEATFNGTATYHDSCAGLRELDISSQPRKLLASVTGLSLQEMNDPDVCCGFGGTFAIKYGDISNAIVSKKTKNIVAVEPDLLIAGDLGCLMNMAGKLKRQGSSIKVRHVAEILADMTDTPAIGMPGNAGENS